MPESESIGRDAGGGRQKLFFKPKSDLAPGDYIFGLWFHCID